MNREITPNEIANAIREVLDERDDLKTQKEEQNKALKIWYEEYHKLKREKEKKDKEIERLSKEVTKYDEILCEKNNEVDRLNNIINELEKYCNIYIGMNFNMNNSKLQEQIVEDYTNILDKLKELKEGK